MSQEHITIAVGRYSSLALNASEEPARCKSDDRKLRAVCPRAQASRALSSVSAKATRRRSRRPSRLLPASPGGRPRLSADLAGRPARPRLRTSGCSGGPSARHPQRPLPTLPGPQPPPTTGSSAQRRLLPSTCWARGCPLPTWQASLPSPPPILARHPSHCAPAPPAPAEPLHKGPGGAPSGGWVDAPAAPPAP